MKRAFVTGITGQDGSYLAEFLLSKKYEVHGIIGGQVLSTQVELTIYMLIRMSPMHGFFFTMETSLIRSRSPIFYITLNLMKCTI